jgi:hypothetical protein
MILTGYYSTTKGIQAGVSIPDYKKGKHISRMCNNEATALRWIYSTLAAEIKGTVVSFLKQGEKRSAIVKHHKEDLQQYQNLQQQISGCITYTAIAKHLQQNRSKYRILCRHIAKDSLRQTWQTRFKDIYNYLDAQP